MYSAIQVLPVQDRDQTDQSSSTTNRLELDRTRASEDQGWRGVTSGGPGRGSCT